MKDAIQMGKRVFCKWSFRLLAAAILTAASVGARADFTGVPGVLSAPVILYDDGGNPLPDGEYGVTVTFKGSDGATLFEERHAASVVNGVAALTLGAGDAADADEYSGGLSGDIFLASDEITVEIRVDGLSIVQEAAVLGSQPYAFVSDYAIGVAPDAVTGTSIRDGSVTENDLEPSFLAALRPFLEVSVGGEEGGSAAVLTADVITVGADSTFDNSAAMTVDGVLRDLDASLSSLRAVEFPDLLGEVGAELEGHAQAASGVHGVIGDLVGTSDVQAVSNKVLDETNVISGSAIRVGEIGESYIADEIARDSELAFANLSGELSDSQIPSAIARDTELAFSNLNGMASDSQIPSAIVRDSELTFSNLSGAASDSQIPSTIARDSELSFSNLSGAASDAQIPSSIARDAELAFSSLSGSASDSQIPSAIARDSELAFSNLAGTASASQIPSSLKPFAYGTFSRPSGGTCSGFNVDSDCTFSTNASSSTYYVLITAQASLSCGGYAGGCYVSSKSTSSFAITCQCPTGGSLNPQLDFVVFQQ